MKRLLVIGASGLLGGKILGQARGKYEAIGTYSPEVDGRNLWRFEPLDIGSKSAVESILRATSPDLVILTAAMTNVDACEVNPTEANRVNASGPANVAWSCRAYGLRLVHVSTDYVFDGRKTRRYTERDAPRPISVYGSTKLAGERAVLSALPGAMIARPAVLYGWNPLTEKDNFVTWVLKRLRKGERVPLFQDQRVSPTFADDLAKTLLDLADRNVSGIWHVSGSDCLDRPECGRMIARAFGLDEELVAAVRSSSVSLPARRPAHSCLDVSKVEKLLNRRMMTFESGLRTMMNQEAKKG